MAKSTQNSSVITSITGFGGNFNDGSYPAFNTLTRYNNIINYTRRYRNGL
jgi:hypothetical protein